MKKYTLAAILFLLTFFLKAQEIAERIPFLDGEKYGYADAGGKLVIPAEYDEVSEFVDGAAKVKKNGFYGLIDEDGRIMVSIALESMGEWREGMIRYSNEGKDGFYNSRGIRVISAQYTLSSEFYEGMAYV